MQEHVGIVKSRTNGRVAGQAHGSKTTRNDVHHHQNEQNEQQRAHAAAREIPHLRLCGQAGRMLNSTITNTMVRINPIRKLLFCAQTLFSDA